MTFLTSNLAKVIGACLGAVAATLFVFFPPPHIIGVVCATVSAVLASLGLVSSGIQKPAAPSNPTPPTP